MTVRFLGGAVVARQPETGFRAGLDAVMLAAAIPAISGETVLELGAGAGTASLCLAARVPGLVLTGVEIDPALALLAAENAAANKAAIDFIAADIFAAKFAGDFDHVFCNPPFHHASGAASPDAARARALMDGALADSGRLADWLALGLKRTLPGGSFTIILRADRMAGALTVLPDSGVTALPLWPHAGEPAKRVILAVRKGSRAPFRLLAGLVLHEAGGGYTPDADAVLRQGKALALDSRRL